MTELYQTGSDLFQIHTNRSTMAYEGTQLGILVYCVQILKMQPSQLEAALLDMIKKDHDSANFDLSGTFIYSFSRDEKYGRKVS